MHVHIYVRLYIDVYVPVLIFWLLNTEDEIAAVH